ncbi:MAG: hypothetical protein ACI9KE_002663 [Polyangiales bacterium]|jgi:hypothetical protein
MRYVSSETSERVSADGRWNGRVTRRGLPELEVRAFSPELRARMAGIWLMQAATESRVARSFEIIGDSLRALHADSGIIRLASRAVDDEHRHAALCEELAGAYAGRPVGPHVALPHRTPEHRDVQAAVRHALYVVGQCALNETFASAYLSAAQVGATVPLAASALKELTSDEIDHARVGWAFLTDMPEEMRRPMSDWILPLTVCNLREWRDIQLPKDDSLACHGVPPQDLARQYLNDALVGVLLPGFRHVGLDTRALEAWVRSGASTETP